jgi:hypothetical protein
MVRQHSPSGGSESSEASENGEKTPVNSTHTDNELFPQFAYKVHVHLILSLLHIVIHCECPTRYVFVIDLFVCYLLYHADIRYEFVLRI